MPKIIKLCLIAVITLFISNTSYSQFVSKFSLFGGPMIGWQVPNVDDINTELRRAGIPEISESGFLTLGGGGYIDVPKVEGLRIGGLGLGYSTQTTTTTANNVTKTVNYEMGYGGLSVEYVHSLGSVAELTFGTTLATGTLVLDIYQYTPGTSSWSGTWNEITNTSSSSNISRQLALRFYSANPKVGLGLLLKSYLYAKLNVGYMVSANGNWKTETGEVINDAPSGIKANGFNFDFSLNFGLFFR